MIQQEMNTTAVTTRAVDRPSEHLKSFGDELDALRKRVTAQLGAEDVQHLERARLVSRSCEIVGRALIHFSFEPITFGAGVVALWAHKQLEVGEIGHSVLHGAYDNLPVDESFRSKNFWWNVPIDEESWRYGHNVRHHGHTNVAGKDPDIHFGPIRLNEQTPYEAGRHALQLPFALFVLWPNFTFLLNVHFTGLADLYEGNGRGGHDFIKDRSLRTWAQVHWRATRKYVPYYLKEYAVFPVLAGPFFWKVMLGNYLSELLRDVYSAATIYCGHVGEDVESYPEGTRPKGRGQWYAMQVEGSHNFEVPLPVSVMCGALDRQIEHHLFPRLPPNRLREIAPEVKEICERHGVKYRSDSWPRTLWKAVKQIARLSAPVQADLAHGAS